MEGFISSYYTIITVKNQSAWDVQSKSWHVKVLEKHMR